MAEVLVRYFAGAVDAAGRESEVVAASTVAEVLDQLRDRYGPQMERIIRTGSQLSDGIAVRDARGPVGARLDILPPFSGG
ncbi:MoaD/ThiS family protein [Protaetiibacter mangrovi]|uniref:MoaD/ThiS family protein n=1 Tax=Protaetiibacter mangrovi TaxID=2970926 RepID=A0ABT1ZED7_9MICO|nr:MoaD/ThiS family protein [Protaetiibacter mangrovi]MCS0499062.1 MoaD/ThiS family protein [Protaetiibacter mangrovi]